MSISEKDREFDLLWTSAQTYQRYEVGGAEYAAAHFAWREARRPDPKGFIAGWLAMPLKGWLKHRPAVVGRI